MEDLNKGIKSIDVKDRFDGRLDNLNKNVENLKEADGIIPKIGYGAAIGLSGFRVATGAVTTPLIIALEKLGQKLPQIGKLIVQPLQIPTFLFSKAFSTKSKYNGKTITNCGETLGDLIGGLSKVSSRAVSIL